MKNLWIIILFLAGLSCGQSIMTIGGQAPVKNSLVTWASGANTLKTRIKIVSPDSVNHRVHLDTSAGTQAGEWKRIDNTADSCSQPFLLAADTLGSRRPVWEYRLWQLTKAVDADSSAHIFRIQTRECLPHPTLGGRYFCTPWTIKGANSGYADITVVDSVLVPNIRQSASKFSQYTLFHVAGTQGRLCPDNAVSTAKAIGDSVIIDSLRVLIR